MGEEQNTESQEAQREPAVPDADGLQQPVEARTEEPGEPHSPPTEPHETAGHAAAIVKELETDAARQMGRMSRRSLLWGAAAIASGLTARNWLITQRAISGLPWPFRLALEADEQLARDFYRVSRRAPTFPAEGAEMPRANGDLGISDTDDITGWKLRVIGLAAPPKDGTAPSTDPTGQRSGTGATENKKQGSSAPPGEGGTIGDTTAAAADISESALVLGMDAIRALPKVTMITELKCIEGWSTIVRWSGARLSDFIERYPPMRTDGALPSYVGLETPDGEYYVGLDIESAQHPQTLLCYEMNGQPLTPDHGAPLRLAIPVKYGIKNIKRIGVIRFTDERPRDYWAERGYDWYAGL